MQKPCKLHLVLRVSMGCELMDNEHLGAMSFECETNVADVRRRRRGEVSSFRGTSVECAASYHYLIPPSCLILLHGISLFMRCSPWNTISQQTLTCCWVGREKGFSDTADAHVEILPAKTPQSGFHSSHTADSRGKESTRSRIPGRELL